MSPQEYPTPSTIAAAKKQQQQPQQQADTASSKKDGARDALQLLSWTDFVNPHRPWVLVDNGSLGGFFDYVPVSFRIGPWSATALCYLTALYYLTALAGAYFWSDVSRPIYSTDFTRMQYPAIFSPQWCYQVTAALWMVYVMYLIVTGPAGFAAWGTYTVQSWTLLWLRHVLCAAAPVSSAAAVLAEWLRFPTACSVTVTFVVWNFLIAPFVYAVGMDTPEKKRGFVKFCTSFRLTQIHVFNVVFLWANVYWASPARLLEGVDFYLAVISVMVYMTFYLAVLDRIGVHLYPVFSPRTGVVVVVTWTLALCAYLASFVGWRHYMRPVHV